MVHKLTTTATIQKCKIGQVGAWTKSHNLFLNFGTPLYISGTHKVRDFKFGVQI